MARRRFGNTWRGLRGLAGLLPDIPNDGDAIARGMGETLASFFNQFHNPDPGSYWFTIQLAIGDPYFFFGAVDRGLIDDTLAGFTTLAALMNQGTVKVAESGRLTTAQLAAWRKYIDDYLAAMPLAQAATDAAIEALKAQTGGGTLWLSSVGPFPAKPFMRDALEGKLGPLGPGTLDESNAVWNGATRGWVPREDVASLEELPDGMMRLVLKDGRSWGWPGPNYVAPAAAPTWTGKVAIDWILDRAIAGPPWPSVAFRQQEFLTDGTVTAFPWQARGDWTTPEQILATYSGPGETIQKYGSTVRVRFWDELTDAERSELARILQLPPGLESPWSEPVATPGPAGPWTDAPPPPLPSGDLQPGVPRPPIEIDGPTGSAPVPLPLPGGTPSPAGPQPLYPVSPGDDIAHAPSSPPLQAGLGTAGTVLLGGALVGLAIAALKKKKGRRPRGYTSNRRR